MRIPHNMTEDEVIKTIRAVAKKLSAKYKYGFHEQEDMEQEAFLIAIRAMEKYDEAQPLENYLTVCLRHTFLNERRKHVERAETPCNRCALYIMSKCHAFEGRLQCERFGRWHQRNVAKRLLANGVSKGVVGHASQNTEIHHENEREDCGDFNLIDNKEIIDKIEAKIPLSMRKQYLKWKGGIRLGNKNEQIIKDMLINIATELNLYGGT